MKKKKKGRAGRVLTTIFLSVVLLAGLGVMLYPAVSDYINSLSQTRAIAQFNEEISRMSEEDYSMLIAAAADYNEKLAENPLRFSPSETQKDEYYRLFDFSGKGFIGVVEIEAIGVNLPVYLGTEENALQVGIGHLIGSSFPIGGPGTHSVISGHRGLPTSMLLTDASILEEGDTFVLRILNEVMFYQIDQIRIVEPEDFTYLGIDPDKDYCTVFTCTPYGLNTHRLLIRGQRIFPEHGEIISANIRANARR
ncbi:MAG: class C sortase, partial [Oscillospiraceae bacterium]|nr:class C sortase [Oscillospiraceae bacterium]